MKAEMKLVVKLHSPDDVWTNVETVNTDNEKTLGAYCIQRIAKLLGEGGILEMYGPLSWNFKPAYRFVSIDVSAVVDGKTIDLATSENFNAAKQIADQEKLLRQPGAPVMFRNKKDVM